VLMKLGPDIAVELLIERLHLRSELIGERYECLG
jgi:hypothetical protein